MDISKPTLLILGATSDMARATALVFCKEGWNLLLAGRDLVATASIARDLALRAGYESTTFPVYSFDAFAPETHEAFWNGLPCCPEVVLCAVGGGGDPLTAQHDLDLTDRILRANFTGLVPVLSLAANAFEKRGSGTIIGIGSVAGDRGRAANYVYGSAKAGFATFLAGLRNRLADKGVHVITVKPGFAATAMSNGLDLPPLLTAQPAEIGIAIFKAYKAKRDTVYVKWIWRWIMFLIIHTPEFVFKRTNLKARKQRS
jgi:decaprenylphospho-beta-D-erythro-pentofuranosid-2-ulose 2-reductase